MSLDIHTDVIHHLKSQAHRWRTNLRDHDGPLWRGQENPALVDGFVEARGCCEFCQTWLNQTEITVQGIHYIQENNPHKIGEALAAFVRSLRNLYS